MPFSKVLNLMLYLCSDLVLVVDFTVLDMSLLQNVNRFLLHLKWRLRLRSKVRRKLAFP